MPMVTSEQVQHYREQGYVTAPRVFAAAQLAPVDAYLRRNVDVAWPHRNDDPLREAHYHDRPLCEVALHDSYTTHGSEPNRSAGRRAALTVRYVPATTRIKDQPDRKQYLIRGRAADNGNVYYIFGA